MCGIYTLLHCEACILQILYTCINYICFICNTNVIEDEQHFTCVCNEYSQLREIIFSNVHNLAFNVMSNEEKMYI